MAFEKTHSLQFTNDEGTQTVYDLFQNLSSAPASVKKLPLTDAKNNERIEIRSSTDRGEGIVTTFCELTMQIANDDPLLDALNTAPFGTISNGMMLIITVGATEQFKGFLNPLRHEQELASGLQQVDALFTEGVAAADTVDWLDVQLAINSSGNSFHAIENVPIADLLDIFIYEPQGLRGADVVEATRLRPAHWDGTTLDEKNLLRELFINANSFAFDDNVADAMKAIAIAFGLTIGWSVELDKIVAAEVFRDDITSAQATLAVKNLGRRAPGVDGLRFMTNVDIPVQDLFESSFIIESENDEKDRSKIRERAVKRLTIRHRDSVQDADLNLIETGWTNNSIPALGSSENISREVPFDSLGATFDNDFGLSVYDNSLKKAVFNHPIDPQPEGDEFPNVVQGSDNSFEFNDTIYRRWLQDFRQRWEGTVRGLYDPMLPTRMRAEPGDTVGWMVRIHDGHWDVRSIQTTFKAVENGTFNT